MSSVQFNMKLDADLKKKAQALAKKYGLSLSDVLRSFVCYFVRAENVGFLLENHDEDDTDPDLTGAQLEKNLLADGWEPERAKRHGEAYDEMLEDEKAGKLVNWRDI